MGPHEETWWGALASAVEPSLPSCATPRNLVRCTRLGSRAFIAFSCDSQLTCSKVKKLGEVHLPRQLSLHRLLVRLLIDIFKCGVIQGVHRKGYIRGWYRIVHNPIMTKKIWQIKIRIYEWMKCNEVVKFGKNVVPSPCRGWLYLTDFGIRYEWQGLERTKTEKERSVRIQFHQR